MFGAVIVEPGAASSRSTPSPCWSRTTGIDGKGRITDLTNRPARHPGLGDLQRVAWRFVDSPIQIGTGERVRYRLDAAEHGPTGSWSSERDLRQGREEGVVMTAAIRPLEHPGHQPGAGQYVIEFAAAEGRLADHHPHLQLAGHQGAFPASEAATAIQELTFPTRRMQPSLRAASGPVSRPHRVAAAVRSALWPARTVQDQVGMSDTANTPHGGRRCRSLVRQQVVAMVSSPPPWWRASWWWRR